MTTSSPALAFSLALGDAAQRVAQRLDSVLGAVRGISLAEYRLLAALAAAPGARASRVDLALAVGLTPSGVTRALKPMEKTGIVATLRSKRDARLAIAGLTPAGRELLDDATGIVEETIEEFIDRSPVSVDELDAAITLLRKLSR
jgi:DNA-binding MarR family transcriptional regulator